MGEITNRSNASEFGEHLEKITDNMIKKTGESNPKLKKEIYETAMAMADHPLVGPNFFVRQILNHDSSSSANAAQ